MTVRNSEGSILIPKIELDNRKKSLSKFLKKKWVVGLGVFISVFILSLAILGYLVFRVYKKAVIVASYSQSMQNAVNEQDLDKVKGQLSELNIALTNLKSEYRLLSWLKVLPYLGKYVADVGHALNAGVYGIEAANIVVDTIEPYADIIGFRNGSGDAQNPEETTQDRLDFVVKTLPDLIPKADLLAEKMTLVKNEVDAIDPDDYPKSVRGVEINSKIEKAKEMVDLGADLIIKGKPLLQQAPSLLGSETEKQYLILFQNDKELRPTGGFITAYTIGKINKGKFEPIASSDIYSLDNSYKPSIPAPDPLITYLKGPYVLSNKYRLRDLNWNPDFEKTMEVFTEEAKSVGIRNIDGVIAVDTQVLVNILDVLGPIGVPGFGNFSNSIVPECNCPQVIYELESFADVEGPVVWSQDEPGKIIFAPPNYDNRKKIIGPLMNSVLSNALGQPKEKLPALFEAVLKSLLEKHVLFYMTDSKSQEAVKKFGIGGTIDAYDGDYLHVNDSNLGGRKSNLYVTQEVEQEVIISADGSVEKAVTITYKNPAAYDGWLNSVLPNWVRVYVPLGSELVSIDGLKDTEKPYEELGKTVFAGFFELRPQGIAKVSLTYKLPFKVSKEYKLYIQKQPGKDTVLHQFTVGRKQEEFSLRTDKEVKIKL